VCNSPLGGYEDLNFDFEYWTVMTPSGSGGSFITLTVEELLEECDDGGDDNNIIVSQNGIGSLINT
jgi:hypothetical protein